MKKIKEWWAKRSNKLKAAVTTALQTFVAAFSIALFGWLADVQEWFDSSVSGEFPSVSPLGKAAGSAAVAALSGLITYVYRAIKPVATTYDGEIKP